MIRTRSFQSWHPADVFSASQRVQSPSHLGLDAVSDAIKAREKVREELDSFIIVLCNVPVKFTRCARLHSCDVFIVTLLIFFLPMPLSFNRITCPLINMIFF
jgi:hypothetical protein